MADVLDVEDEFNENYFERGPLMILSKFGYNSIKFNSNSLLSKNHTLACIKTTQYN